VNLTLTKKGYIPMDSYIGDKIGLHGVSHREEYFIEKQTNWTMGCVALRINDINELNDIFPLKTKVRITKDE
jgi:lipoprotein-anchoring transpeptidase ErfK/SrfK